MKDLLRMRLFPGDCERERRCQEGNIGWPCIAAKLLSIAFGTRKAGIKLLRNRDMFNLVVCLKIGFILIH